MSKAVCGVCGRTYIEQRRRIYEFCCACCWAVVGCFNTAFRANPVRYYRVLCEPPAMATFENGSYFEVINENA